MLHFSSFFTENKRLDVLLVDKTRKSSDIWLKQFVPDQNISSSCYNIRVSCMLVTIIFSIISSSGLKHVEFLGNNIVWICQYRLTIGSKVLIEVLRSLSCMNHVSLFLIFM